MGNIFLVQFHFFLGGGGVLEIPDVFLGWTVDAGPKPTYGKKKKKYPPPPPHPPPGLSHDNHLIVHIRGRLWCYPSANGLNNTSTISNRGGIVSIRSSTVVNRSAAVLSRRSVDKSCSHRRSIVRHRVDPWFFFFFHPDTSRCTMILPSDSNRDKSWWIVAGIMTV